MSSEQNTDFTSITAEKVFNAVSAFFENNLKWFSQLPTQSSFSRYAFLSDYLTDLHREEQNKFCQK